MKRLIFAVLLATLSAPAYAEGGIAANRGACVDGSPRAYIVYDGASATDCTSGGGEFDVNCCCLDGAWSSCASAGAGTNSFNTIDAPAGTDPVADSTSDTLTLTCTGATCTGDSATDTLTIAVTGGDPTLAGDVDGLGSTNDLDEASVEVELEAVLDLENLQGAVTDGQVPNTITIDLATTATTANTGDTATAFFAAGVLEAERGGTGVNSLLATGVPLVSSGTWTFNAGISHLAASTSADARAVLSDEVGTGAAMFGLISTMADDLACTGDQVVKRNAGDTAFECGTPAGGSGLTHPQIMARIAVGGGY